MKGIIFTISSLKNKTVMVSDKGRERNFVPKKFLGIDLKGFCYSAEKSAQSGFRGIQRSTKKPVP